jgi:FkbM family methyltransferase
MFKDYSYKLASASKNRIKSRLGRHLGYWKKTLTVNINENVKIKFKTEHPIAKKWFYPRYFFGDVHEPGLTYTLLHFMKPKTVFYDIGSNLGFFSILGQTLCEGEIHSFEIDPKLTSIMLDSLIINPQNAKQYINNVAVNSSSERLVTFIPEQHGNPSTNQISLKAHDNCINVGTTSIDNYVQKGYSPPMLIKMDIEGAEYEAIEGMHDTLKFNKPDFILEVHPKQLKENRISPHHLIDT